MKLFKLTDEHDRTFGGCQWGEGVEHMTSGKGELCGPGWLHAYTDPLVAVLLNPIHANFNNAHLWEADGDVGAEHNLKVGCTRLTTVRRLDMPEIGVEQRVRFAVLCALETNSNPAFVAWARGWLRALDRTGRSANVAEEAAENANARSAAWASAAAEAAAWVENEQDAREMAWWASVSAEAAAEAAVAVAEEGVDIDIADIARRAVYGKASDAENNGEV
jgi:hypothetical protein